MAIFSFDVGTIEQRNNQYELLPAGWYEAQITESEIVPLKSGNGRALKLTLDVLSLGYRGRKLWVRLNIEHTNPQAETIGRQQLAELCSAVGLSRLADTSELHYKPVGIKVKIRKDTTGQYEDQNDVSGYKPAGGSTASVPRAATPPSAPATPTAAPAAPAGSPPWARKAA